MMKNLTTLQERVHHGALTQAVSGTCRTVETKDVLSRTFLAATYNSSRKVRLPFVEQHLCGANGASSRVFDHSSPFWRVCIAAFGFEEFETDTEFFEANHMVRS